MITYWKTPATAPGPVIYITVKPHRDTTKRIVQIAIPKSKVKTYCVAVNQKQVSKVLGAIQAVSSTKELNDWAFSCCNYARVEHIDAIPDTASRPPRPDSFAVKPAQKYP